jgi:hypothetical protein
MSIQRNNMKKTVFLLTLLLGVLQVLQAQYMGGNGRGDHSLESFPIPLSNEENVSSATPGSVTLLQNYPNPFHSSTNIEFYFAVPGHVKLIVYDVRGCEIQTLINKVLKPGTYVVPFDGSSHNSGTYFCKIVAGDYSETNRMILDK